MGGRVDEGLGAVARPATVRDGDGGSRASSSGGLERRGGPAGEQCERGEGAQHRHHTVTGPGRQETVARSLGRRIGGSSGVCMFGKGTWASAVRPESTAASSGAISPAEPTNCQVPASPIHQSSETSIVTTCTVAPSGRRTERSADTCSTADHGTSAGTSTSGPSGPLIRRPCSPVRITVGAPRCCGESSTGSGSSAATPVTSGGRSTTPRTTTSTSRAAGRGGRRKDLMADRRDGTAGPPPISAVLTRFSGQSTTLRVN